MRRAVFTKPILQTAEVLWPLFDFVRRRSGLWVPGLAPSMGLKDDDTLWVVSGFSHPPATVGLSLSRLGRLIPALSKRHGRRAAYQAALSESVLPHTQAPSFLFGMHGMHAVPIRKYSVLIHSLVAIVMAHFKNLDPPRTKRWVDSRWGDGVAFIPGTPHGSDLASRLVKDCTATAIVIENQGVILQSSDELVQSGVIQRWERLEREFCRHYKLSLLESIWGGATPLLTQAPLKHYFSQSWGLHSRMLDITHGTLERTLKPIAWQRDYQSALHFRALQILWLVCPELREALEITETSETPEGTRNTSKIVPKNS